MNRHEELLWVVSLAALGAACSKETPPAAPVATGSAAGGGGAVAFAPYTPKGCDYSVAVPAGVDAMMGDGTVGGPPLVDNVHASFAGKATASFAVSWRTETTTTATELLFGTQEQAVAAAEGPGEGVRAQTGHTMLYSTALDGGVQTRVHEAHACGLVPATRYFYKAGAPAAWGKIYDVTTSPEIGTKQPWRLAAMGDTRDGPDVFARLQEMVLAAGTGVQIFTGDAVSVGLAQSGWNALLSAPGKDKNVQEILARIPLMTVNGNHDNLALNYLAQLALPQELSPGETDPEQWYSFDYANAHIVVLDDSGPADSILQGEERAFLEKDLAAVDRQKTPWLIAAHHRPMYSCSEHGSNLDLRSAWQPLYDKFQVDLVFNGHDHNYERSKPIRGDGVVAEQGPEGQPVAQSGTVYVVAGAAGAPLYESGKDCKHTYKNESVYHYVALEIADKAMKYRAYRLDSTLLDSFDYQK
ncbi:MAG: metallophosphoesterase [Deltaproteobacteria bacterium]|nr:metallophosphoesterase [Deltaproteobacteria bacterium]